ncbi:MAG: polyprenyl diphosphate synthase [Acidobacteriota bacterium]|nr:polyprenyl diphosphate synthase [Acidobacteriota bacterium]
MPANKANHVAVIMDGNGRWAKARGLDRTEGHRQGVEVAAKVVDAAIELGIQSITLYAFSCDNWKRPESEVSTLMGLMHEFLLDETPRCLEKGVRLNVIGRRDRLRPEIQDAIERAEALTEGQDKLVARVAIDYSARDVLTRAAAMYEGASDDRDAFNACLSRAMNADEPMPPIDLLIRTSGEQRLSDFLLWEAAYAELLFVEKNWPDFTPEDLAEAVKEFEGRGRRFGAVAPEPAALV